MFQNTIDEIVEDVAADGYEFYRNLFKAIKEEDDDFAYMTHDQVSDLAVELVPIAMKRYYGQNDERNDI